MEDTWRICAGNGDYATLQRENEMEFCADKDDGWQVSDNIIQNFIRRVVNDCQVSGRVPVDVTQLPCCLDSDFLGLPGYVLWDGNRNPSFKCRAFSWADQMETSPTCRECREDVTKCQI